MKENRRSHWVVTKNLLHGWWQVQYAKPSRAGYDILPPTGADSGFATKKAAADRKRWLDRNHPARGIVR